MPPVCSQRSLPSLQPSQTYRGALGFYYGSRDA